MSVVTISRETVTEFIVRMGGVANTSNIAMRFGWDRRDAYKRLCGLERDGVIWRSGIGPLDDLGRVQNWQVPAPPAPRSEA